MEVPRRQVSLVVELTRFAGEGGAALILPKSGSRCIMPATFTRRPLVAGSLLVAITLAAVTLGGAGLARWRGSQARSPAQG
jgi:hypothetical protein